MSIAPTASIRGPIHRSPDDLAALIGSWRGPALLEGGPDFGDGGRFSILSARPRAVFSAVGNAWSYRDRSGETRGSETFTALAELLERFGLADPSETPGSHSPPFLGGLIGTIGYDLAPLLESIPRKAPRDSTWPDLRLAVHDTAVIVDHESGSAELLAFDVLGEGPDVLSRRFRGWKRDLCGPVPPNIASGFGPIRSNFEPGAYKAAVRAALEYIGAGDIFQVNLSQRFSARGRIDPLDLHRRLRARSPAPFSAFLRSGARAVVSASPEWFYRTEGDRIVTRPIKGTRPRGRDPLEDARLADELRRSPKDRAELTMIVDLERNDLGRVCRFGSVRVTGGPEVERFAQVHHLVSTVEGRLRQDVGPVDVLKALFPGGSITGAPKIRAMEVIDELEPCRRGVYTGAIGYFSRGGLSAFNIAIRTLLIEGSRASYQVGGGIVADSDPDSEYEETLHKGRGIRDVLEGWGLPR